MVGVADADVYLPHQRALFDLTSLGDEVPHLVSRSLTHSRWQSCQLPLSFQWQPPFSNGTVATPDTLLLVRRIFFEVPSEQY